MASQTPRRLAFKQFPLSALSQTTRVSVGSRVLYRPVPSRAASSSSSPSPPVPSSSAPPKKLGLISWIRSEIGENLLGEPVSPQQLADAKQAALYQSGSLFDRAENELLSKARDDVKRRLERHFRGKQVPEIPQGLGLRGLMKWEKKTMQPRPTEHRYSTAMFKISHRKLNDLGRQISGKPVDQAILQMVFSEKRASKRLKSMLCVARDHAVDYKGLDRDKLIVSQAWVEKGAKLKRVEIKGRGRSGIREHPNSRLRVILSHGQTYEERIRKEHSYKLGMIRSPGLMRENTPVRNYGPAWAW